MPNSLTFSSNNDAAFPNIYEIYENVPFSVAVLRGPDLIIEYINRLNLSIWRCTRESVMGKPLYEAKPELRNDVEALHREVQETGNRFQANEVPIEIIDEDGTRLHYFQVSIDPIRDADGNIIGQIATSIDVTEQVMYRQQLEKSEHQYRLAKSEGEKLKRLYEAVTGNTPDLVYVFDLNHKFTYANPTLLAMWGRDLQEAIGRGVREVGYEGWQANIYEQEINRVIITKQSANGTYSFVHKDLGERTYDYLLAPVLNEIGEVEAIAGITRDVSEQKVAEEALKKSEQHLETLRNAVPAMIFYLDKEERYQTYNDTFCKWFNVNKTEAIGKTVREFIGEAAYRVVSPHLRKSYNGEVEQYEIEAPSRAGDGRWFNIVYTPDKNDDGDVQGVIVLATDVTASKLTEIAIRESEHRFQNLIRDANLGIIVLSGKDMVVSVANDAYGKVIGYNVDQLLGKPLFDVVPETNLQDRQLLEKVRETGQSVYLYDTPYSISSEGVNVQRYLNVIYQAYRETDGQITGVVALAQDVTEQVIARQHLQEANERASLAIESGGLGTVEVNLQTEEVALSPRAKEIFELHAAPQRTDYLNSLHPDDQILCKKVYELALLDGNLEYEARIIRNDNSIRWIKTRGRIHFDDANKPLKVVSVVQDITDQKIFSEELERQVKQRTEDLRQAHQLLLASNDYLQQIINIFSAPMQVLRPILQNGNVVDFTYKLTNTAYAAYTTYSPEELINKRVSEVFPGYFETDSFRNIREVAMTGLNNTWENHYAADGLDIFNLMSAALMNEDVVVHMTDFTNMKSLQLELQRKLIELERSNVSLEEFAHASSHDLKEPIRKIHFFTDQLKTDLQKQLSEKQVRLFQRIENATRRMASLIDDLLVYSQVSERPLEKEPVNLNETINLVQEDLELIIAQKGAQIYVGDLPVINGYKRQLQQLFQNLVSNAIKYSKEDRYPVIRISSAQVDGKSIHLEEDMMYYCIKVEDNGIGFQEKYADQIFKMFQRLHAKGEYAGTGIGLSIARRIVDNHRGKIVASGVPDVGATFNVYLPYL
ncbi:PAS domain-containing protein [Chitinophaga rhizophila]|uniref:histidine kinase n=1 Tax=Chitinophaga rhizophila TaxID=2866212 RepID=A0ABS7GAT4_9BACT|nr:PAS domain-containing protein [Chitinophaga rhizophila]MBW8684777.1 PAS domain-containing protein [Chitinophaga rhizophila]